MPATSTKAPSSYHQLEDVLGCKWSVSVMQAVAAGVTRPGALERHIEGISTKVLSERLRKLAAFGLLERHVSGGKPLRTEYTLTPAGRKVVKIVAQIRALDGELRREVQATARPSGQPPRK